MPSFPVNPAPLASASGTLPSTPSWPLPSLDQCQLFLFLLGIGLGRFGEPLCSLTLAHLSGPTQLQKNKEQEEQLGEMIQAYEKLCVEKSDLETELGEMVRPSEWG